MMKFNELWSIYRLKLAMRKQRMNVQNGYQENKNDALHSLHAKWGFPEEWYKTSNKIQSLHNFSTAHRNNSIESISFPQQKPQDAEWMHNTGSIKAKQVSYDFNV